MKASFLSGLTLGFAALLAAAWYYPWVDHIRIPSRTSVLANGGRGELFLIRMPADRLASGSNVESGSRVRRGPKSIELPADVGSTPLLLEEFKVRDSAGDVIGIASRHTIELNRRIETAWNVVIPSRGALFLRGDATASTLDRRLGDAGFQPGQAWAGEVRVGSDTEGAMHGELMGGTGEFQGLIGTYDESWQITGVSAQGELRGTIQLNTVSSTSQ